MLLRSRAASICCVVVGSLQLNLVGRRRQAVRSGNCLGADIVAAAYRTQGFPVHIAPPDRLALLVRGVNPMRRFLGRPFPAGLSGQAAKAAISRLIR
jgi:hypothetical protein